MLGGPIFRRRCPCLLLGRLLLSSPRFQKGEQRVSDCHCCGGRRGDHRRRPDGPTSHAHFSHRFFFFKIFQLFRGSYEREPLLGSRRENTTHPSVSQSPTTRGQRMAHTRHGRSMSRRMSNRVRYRTHTNNQQCTMLRFRRKSRFSLLLLPIFCGCLLRFPPRNCIFF